MSENNFGNPMNVNSGSFRVASATLTSSGNDLSINANNSNITLKPNGENSKVEITPTQFRVRNSDNTGYTLDINQSTGASSFSGQVNATKLALSSTEDATGPGTGALQVPGGLYIAKKLYVGENITVQGNLTVTGETQTSHSGLLNLTNNDDHTQYTLLAGRSAGQTITGSTSSSGNLVLRSTTNATKGSVVLDETTATTSNSTGALCLSGGIATTNTTDAVSATNGGTFTTAGGAAIAKKLFVGTDLNVGGNVTITGTVNIPHSGLTGLTSGDDHTQYTFLTGRSGGQIVTGGTASGNSLVLRSTTNATKGSVLIDETTVSTSDTTGALRVTGGIGISNTTDATSATNGGTLTTAGGAAIAKKLFVGTDLNVIGTVTGATGILDNLGVGTTPSTPIHVLNANPTLRLQHTTGTSPVNGGSIELVQNNLTGMRLRYDGLGDHFEIRGQAGGVPGNFPFAIRNIPGFEGFVGIGTTTPAFPLDVIGGVRSSDGISSTTGTFSGAVSTGALTPTSMTTTGTLGVTGTSTLGVVNSGNTSITGTLGVTGTSTLAAFSATSGSLSGNINMNSNKVTNLGTPTAASDAATKSYVDLAVQGLSAKEAVRVATTGPGTLASSFENGDTIDGITLVTNDRILIKDQSNAIENGIYIVNVSGAPTRASDFVLGSSESGSFVFVTSGTVNGDNGFVVVTDPPNDIVGTNGLTFTQFSGAGQITAGTGLTKSGNTLSVNAAQTQITSVGTLSGLAVSGGSTLSTISSSNTTASTSNSTGSVTLAGGIGISNTTDASSSTNGGTLTTAGGIGVAKKIYTGSSVHAYAGLVTHFGQSNISLEPGLWASPKVLQQEYNTLFPDQDGTFLYSAGGSAGSGPDYVIGYNTFHVNLNPSSSVDILPTTASTSNTTGALRLAGGIGISNTTDATSSTNGGTLTTAGGAAIAKKLFVGTDLNVSGASTLASMSATTGSFSGNVNMNSNVITNVGTPVSASDAATKGYVDLLVQGGLAVLEAVRVATTGPGTLASSFENGDTVDGITLVTGDRILIKDQSNAIENGVYVVNTSGAPTRAYGFLLGDEVSGVFLFVLQGTTNADKGFIVVSDPPNDVVGTNNIVFTQFSGAGQITAGTGLTKSGDTLSVNASQTHVTSVGTLTGLTSSGVVNVTDTTASTSNSTGALTLAGGIATTNTTDATSATNGGSLTTAGGIAVAKKAFVGTDLSVGGAVSATTLTTTDSILTKTNQIVNGFNAMDLVDTDITNKTLTIAHRFSKLTQPIYSIHNIVNQIKLGVRHVEMDISRTTDGVFFLSHGGTTTEEYETIDVPSPVTQISLKTAMVKKGIPLLNRGESLPTLKEAWEVLKQYDVCIWLEDKKGDFMDLYTEMQALGMTKERVVFQDFDINAVEYFKDNGYRVSFTGTAVEYDNLTTTQKNKIDYIGTNISQASGVDAFNKPFITYTHNDVSTFITLKDSYPNLVGCYSDTVLPQIHGNMLNPYQTSLLNPLNYRVCHTDTGGNTVYDPTCSLTWEHGNPRLSLKLGPGVQASNVFTFYNYKLPEQFYFKYEYPANNNTAFTQWLGFLVRFEKDYLERDVAGSRVSSINIFHRLSGFIELGELNNGTATLLPSPPLRQIVGKGPQYASFRRVIVDTTATFYFKSGPTPQDVADPTVSPSRTFSSSSSYYLEDMYLSFHNRATVSNTVNGYIEYSETPYAIENTNVGVINSTATTASTSNSTGALTLAGGIATTNTTDAISATNGGTLTTAGGAAIAKKLFVGDNITTNGWVYVQNTSWTTNGNDVFVSANNSTVSLRPIVSSSNNAFEIDTTSLRYRNSSATTFFSISPSTQIMNLTTTTTSTSNTTGAFTLSGGIGISNTTDATSATNGGTFTTAGGAAIAKKLFVGTDLAVSGVTSLNTLTASGLITGTNGMSVSGSIADAPTGNGVHAGITPGSFACIQLNGGTSSTLGSHIDFGYSGHDFRGRFLYTNDNDTMVLYTAGDVRGSIDSTGIVSFISTTSSTSNSTGALKLSGGIGISNATDAVSATNGGTFTTAGGAAVAKKLFVGTDASIAGTLGVTGTSTLGVVNSGNTSITGTLGVSGASTLAAFSATSGSLSGNINMNSNKITNLGTPAAASDAATKSYVDLAVQGLSAKEAVRVATTGPGTLASSFENGDTVDGITLATNDRILIKDQTNPIENGIYVVNVSGAPTRASDFALGSSESGSFVFVSAGTVNGDNGFVVITDPPNDIVGTNGLTFTQFSGAGQITAGTGLTKTGNTLSVNAAQTQITSVGTLSSLTVSGGSTLSTISSSDTTASTSNSTGALTLAGGIGISNTTDTVSTTNGGSFTTAGGASIAKSLRVGTTLFVKNGSWTSNGDDVFINGNTASISLRPTVGSGANSIVISTTETLFKNSANTNSFILNKTTDSISIVGQLISSNSTTSTSNSTGALTLAGGIGISNTTDATSATNGGTFTTAGGAGIAKKLFVGETITSSGDYVFAGTGVIRSNTVDGADNQLVVITGGGANDGADRGAKVMMHGSEHPSFPGRLSIVSTSTGDIDFYTGNLVRRGSISPSGIWDITTTTATTSNSTGALTLAGGIGISNTTNATSTTNGGSFTTAGGAAIALKLFVGDSTMITRDIEYGTAGVGTYLGGNLRFRAGPGWERPSTGDAGFVFRLGNDVDLYGDGAQLLVAGPSDGITLSANFLPSGRIQFHNTTATTSVSTGALRLAGGIGISNTTDATSATNGGTFTTAGGIGVAKKGYFGNTVYIGGTPNTGTDGGYRLLRLTPLSGSATQITFDTSNTSGSGQNYIFSDSSALELLAPSYIFAGTGSTTIGGALISTATTASTSNSTGALRLAGGIGISNTTDTSSITNGGTFTTAGGASIGKRLFIGNSIHIGENPLDGDRVAFIVNRSSASNASAQLRFGNDNIGQDTFFKFNSTNNSSDGGPQAFTIRNNPGPIRLQTNGAGGATITLGWDGNTRFSRNIASTSSTNASVRFAGGISIENATNASSSTNGGTITTAGGAAIAKDLYVGTNAVIGESNPINGERSISIRNTNAGSSAFSMLRLQNDTGNDGIIFVNSSTRSTDGGVGNMTIRNDGGSLRLQSSGANGIHIAGSTGNVSLGNLIGFNTFNVSYAGDNTLSGSPFYNFGARVHNTTASGSSARSNLILFTDDNATQAGIGGYRQNFNSHFLSGILFLVGSQPGGYTQAAPANTTEASNSLSEAARITPVGVLQINGTTASTSSTTGIIQSAGGIGISNATDATSSTNGGTFTTAGGAAIAKNLYVGGALSKGSGTFDIPHPNPEKEQQGYRLRHSFVESPNRGDNIYRYRINTKELDYMYIQMPEYFSYLNEDIQIFVTPQAHFGIGYGIYNPEENRTCIHVNTLGEYNVLIIGTRKDKVAQQGWDAKGLVYKQEE